MFLIDTHDVLGNEGELITEHKQKGSQMLIDQSKHPSVVDSVQTNFINQFNQKAPLMIWSTMEEILNKIKIQFK